MKLAYLLDPTESNKPNHDVMMSKSQNDFILKAPQRRHIYEVKPSSDTVLAYQAEIEKLKSKITQLQDEKSVLVKWVEFLF